MIYIIHLNRVFDYLKLFNRDIISSSRELKCSCKRFDDATIGQQSVSEVISSSVRQQSLESPAASPRVTHLLLRDCAKLDLLIDLANLDQNVFQVTDLSLVNIPTINIEFRWEIELETNGESPYEGLVLVGLVVIMELHIKCLKSQ